VGNAGAFGARAQQRADAASCPSPCTFVQAKETAAAHRTSEFADANGWSTAGGRGTGFRASYRIRTAAVANGAAAKASVTPRNPDTLPNPTSGLLEQPYQVVELSVDLLGVSARRMLNAIAEGEDHPPR